jgi:transcriptional regulator with PAS, ATPase and Fis domain
MTDNAGKQPEGQEPLADAKPPEEVQPVQDETREFAENPYAPEDKKTSDIVRLFYTTGVSIIPVISKRNILLGVLRKEDVISELADLERAGRYSIDQFITKLAKKMSLDELLQYGTIREFTVINLFGEVQGRWTRMQLFAASENPGQGVSAETDMQANKDEQVLEWIIYLILEHIPRALYAVNENGKTIFYNSHFEELYEQRLKSDVNTEFVEESLKNTEKNELFSGDGRKDLYFYNRDFDCNYEKIPLFSKRKRVGFLTYFDSNQSTKENLVISGVDIRGMSLEDILSSVERQLIVHAVKGVDDLKDAAESLKLSKHSLLGRMKKLGVEAKK